MLPLAQPTSRIMLSITVPSKCFYASTIRMGLTAEFTSSLFPWLLRKVFKMKLTVFPFVAVFAIAVSTHAGPADVVTATFVNGTEVPVRAAGFTASGKTLNLSLNFAPKPGTDLVIVENTGPDIIKGTFTNLAQGQIVDLAFAGITYHFVANYHGGAGNDLVLLWTNADSLVDKKLDDQLRLALKQEREQAPFDKTTTLQPDIPGNLPEGALVDIQASRSQRLLDQISQAGGKVIDSSVTTTALQAVVPVSQLESLAGRGDVKFISPAKPAIISRLKP